jgi:hypothetical protein
MTLNTCHFTTRNKSYLYVDVQNTAYENYDIW